MIIRTKTIDGTKEWKEYRHHYIGGSDASCIVGMNPYKSALGLWAEKTDRVPAFEGNIATQCGHVLEPLVAKLWAEKTGKKIINQNCTYQNTEYPYSCANIDRKVTGEKAFLECKTTTSLPVVRGIKKNGQEFPAMYYCQCVHYMAVTGLSTCYLAVLVNNRELYTYELKREDVEEDITALMKAETEFWERYIIGDEMPDADGSTDAATVLSALYPEEAPGKEADIMECFNDIAQYLDRKQQVAEKKREQDEAANKIKQALGDAEIGWCGDHKVTWKCDKNGTRRFAIK